MILFHPCELYCQRTGVSCDEGRQRDYLAVSGKGEGKLGQVAAFGMGVGMGQVASENLGWYDPTACCAILGKSIFPNLSL